MNCLRASLPICTPASRMRSPSASLVCASTIAPAARAVQHRSRPAQRGDRVDRVRVDAPVRDHGRIRRGDAVDVKRRREAAQRRIPVGAAVGAERGKSRHVAQRLVQVGRAGHLDLLRGHEIDRLRDLGHRRVGLRAGRGAQPDGRSTRRRPSRSRRSSAARPPPAGDVTAAPDACACAPPAAAMTHALPAAIALARRAAPVPVTIVPCSVVLVADSARSRRDAPSASALCCLLGDAGCARVGMHWPMASVASAAMIPGE